MQNCVEIIEKRKELWQKYKDDEKDRSFVEAVARHMVNPDSIEIRKELQQNPEYLIEMCFVIVNKDEETVPFFLNIVQIDFMRTYNKARADFEEGKLQQVAFLVLKGRQQGFTSIITAYQLACTLIMKNFTGMTIADNSENTHTIFEDKAKYPYNQLPESLKPSEKFNNRQELHFEKLNSRWRISTSGNRDVGRSKTIRFFHGSEAGYWDSIKKVMTGLGQSLTKRSVRILESTANGMNEFKDLWDDAVSKKNNWTPLFFEWWRTPEYFMEFTDEGQKEWFINEVNTCPDDEKDIFNKIKWLIPFANITWEQAFWYYNKYLDLKDELPQEYPTTPEEAFLSTGKCIFDVEKLRRRKAELLQKYEEKRPIRGKMSYEYDEELQIILTDTIRFIECVSGDIEIFEFPQPNFPYVLGGDISEGGIDFSSGHVINNNTGNEVAVKHGKQNTDIYAKNMFALGWWYNKALIGIEMNFDSHPMKELYRLKYPNLYYRENFDKVNPERIDKLGWRTTQNTRPLIIDRLIELVRDCAEAFNSIEEINELITFVKHDDGSLSADSGKHDDLVMGRGVSELIRSQQSVRVKEPEKELKGTYHYRELVLLGYKKYQIKQMIKKSIITVIGGDKYL